MREFKIEDLREIAKLRAISYILNVKNNKNGVFVANEIYDFLYSSISNIMPEDLLEEEAKSIIERDGDAKEIMENYESIHIGENITFDDALEFHLIEAMKEVFFEEGYEDL